MEEQVVFPRGHDYLTTIRSDQYFELTTDLLGKEWQPFAETVPFVSARLRPRLGNTDTIMERVDDCPLGGTVATRLIAFSNVGAAPIRLTRHDGATKYFDIYATLSPTHDSIGEVTFSDFDSKARVGSFESTADFWPLLELRPLGGGESIWVDTGEVPVPGFPMTIGSSGGSWGLSPSSPNEVRGFRSASVFYRDVVMITATSENNQNARIPMSNPPPTIAACAKAQSQFLDEGGVGVFERMNFGAPKSDANIELPSELG